MCRYVSFPVQTLGKCAKMLPVMAWGTLIMHKRCARPDRSPDTHMSHYCAVVRSPTCSAATQWKWGENIVTFAPQPSLSGTGRPPRLAP